MRGMRTDLAAPQPVRLADYTPPAFQVETVRLDFALEPAATRVKAKLALKRSGPGPLVLDGARLKTLSVALDGKALDASAYTIDETSLTIADVPEAFTLETEVEIDPSANTALEGLYLSGGRFCTQCEPEGFRTITWYPDRPDVLSRFHVRIEADEERATLTSSPTATGSVAATCRGRPPLRRVGRPLSKARLPLRAGGRRARCPGGQLRHHDRPHCGVADLCGPRNGAPRRLRHGRA